MIRAAALALVGVTLCAGAAPAQDKAAPQPGPAVAADAQAATMPAPRPKAAPDGARAYIIWPRDGTVIKGGKFWLRMGLQEMGVAPAKVAWPNAGHHHVVVDAELPARDQPIPNDRNHLHFGGGQTEVRIELPPGRHTLQLVLGDEDHMMFDPPVVSDKITVTVR